MYFIDMDSGPSGSVIGKIMQSDSGGEELVCVVKKSADGPTIEHLNIKYLQGKLLRQYLKVLISAGIIKGG